MVTRISEAWRLAAVVGLVAALSVGCSEDDATNAKQKALAGDAACISADYYLKRLDTEAAATKEVAGAIRRASTDKTIRTVARKVENNPTDEKLRARLKRLLSERCDT